MVWDISLRVQFYANSVIVKVLRGLSFIEIEFDHSTLSRLAEGESIMAFGVWT